MKLACESIDRVLTTEIRLPFLTRGIIPAEYEAARAKIGGPISYAMASAILKCLEEGKNRVAVFTGVYHPENFPNGESDGPLGAAVVGNAIEKLGGDVTYCLEKETIPGTVHIPFCPLLVCGELFRSKPCPFSRPFADAACHSAINNGNRSCYFCSANDGFHR